MVYKTLKVIIYSSLSAAFCLGTILYLEFLTGASTMNMLMSFVMMLVPLSVYANNTLFVNVPKNKNSFVITLEANPTTGYQWSVARFDQDLLTLSSSYYQGPDSKLIGAGGHMLFTFTVNKGKSQPKTTDLFFSYARPWEKADSGVKQKVTLHFFAKRHPG